MKRKKHLIRILCGIGIVILLIVVGFYTKSGVKFVVKLLEDPLDNNAKKYIISLENGKYLGFDVDSHEKEGRKSVFYEKHIYDAWGIYYVEDGEPIGYQGNLDMFPLTKTETGWICNGKKSGYSSYWYYTESIVGNWYWFEMHY